MPRAPRRTCPETGQATEAASSHSERSGHLGIIAPLPHRESTEHAADCFGACEPIGKALGIFGLRNRYRHLECTPREARTRASENVVHSGPLLDAHGLEYRG